MAGLSIYSTPGSRITLNGKQYGQAPNEGWFYIPSLKPAKYVVKVNLSGYREASQTITLRAGSSEFLQMPLVAFPGTLNVSTNIQGATIEIEGVNTFSNRVGSLSLPAGNYQINAWKTGFKRVSQNESIAPGQTRNIQISLEPINVQELLAEAQQSYTSRDFHKAIALCNEVLTVEPGNSRANLCIGLSTYVLKEYDRSFDYLVRAISAGETLRLRVGRRRAFIKDESLEFGQLELTQAELAFNNTTTGKLDFKVPYSKIVKIKVENFYNRYTYSWRISMDILVTKEKNKGKDDKKDFDFYGSSSALQIVTVPDGTKVQIPKIECKECEAEIQFIYRLITNFRDAPRR
jgi:hypothetical protein